MSTAPEFDDVFDPTTDPRHKPATATPGDDPDAPKPRDVAPDQPPPPSEPAVPPSDAPVKPADRPP
jgi:hypothetical protein